LRFAIPFLKIFLFFYYFFIRRIFTLLNRAKTARSRHFIKSFAFYFLARSRRFLLFLPFVNFL